MPFPPLSRRWFCFQGGRIWTACLAWALTRFARVETIGFDYGQRHAIELTTCTRVLERIREVRAVARERLGEDHLVDLRGFGRAGGIVADARAGNPHG